MTSISLHCRKMRRRPPPARIVVSLRVGLSTRPRKAGLAGAVVGVAGLSVLSGRRLAARMIFLRSSSSPRLTLRGAAHRAPSPCIMGKMLWVTVLLRSWMQSRRRRSRRRLQRLLLGSLCPSRIILLPTPLPLHSRLNLPYRAPGSGPTTLSTGTGHPCFPPWLSVSGARTTQWGAGASTHHGILPFPVLFPWLSVRLAGPSRYYAGAGPPYSTQRFSSAVGRGSGGSSVGFLSHPPQFHRAVLSLGVQYTSRELGCTGSCRGAGRLLRAADAHCRTTQE